MDGLVTAREVHPAWGQVQQWSGGTGASRGRRGTGWLTEALPLISQLLAAAHQVTGVLFRATQATSVAGDKVAVSAGTACEWLADHPLGMPPSVSRLGPRSTSSHSSLNGARSQRGPSVTIVAVVAMISTGGRSGIWQT